MAFTYRRIKGQLPNDYERRLVKIRPHKDLYFGRIWLNPNGILRAKADYLWDFASGAIDDKSIIEASLVHDMLCELIHNDLLSYHQWDNAADEMKAVMVEYADNNSKWLRHARKVRAAYVARAIKIAGPTVTQDRCYITI